MRAVRLLARTDRQTQGSVFLYASVSRWMYAEVCMHCMNARVHIYMHKIYQKKVYTEKKVYTTL